MEVMDHLPMKSRFDSVTWANDTGETRVVVGSGHITLFDRSKVQELRDLLTTVLHEQSDWHRSQMNNLEFDWQGEDALGRARRFMGEA